jgi:hypothetical protein
MRENLGQKIINSGFSWRASELSDRFGACK